MVFSVPPVVVYSFFFLYVLRIRVPFILFLLPEIYLFDFSNFIIFVSIPYYFVSEVCHHFNLFLFDGL